MWVVKLHCAVNSNMAAMIQLIRHLKHLLGSMLEAVVDFVSVILRQSSQMRLYEKEAKVIEAIGTGRGTRAKHRIYLTMFYCLLKAIYVITLYYTPLEDRYRFMLFDFSHLSSSPIINSTILFSTQVNIAFLLYTMYFVSYHTDTFRVSQYVLRNQWQHIVSVYVAKVAHRNFCTHVPSRKGTGWKLDATNIKLHRRHCRQSVPLQT